MALASPAAPWKFGNGSRIIVLDPGHGGSDFGTAHNGLVEKTITIDIARRLRTLLTAAGWIVRMTRDSDIDPVSQANLAAMKADGKPNPSDRAYLQTRDDVANDVNARMFISIHVNYSDSPSVNGTTFYWYKPRRSAARSNAGKGRHSRCRHQRRRTAARELLRDAPRDDAGGADRNGVHLEPARRRIAREPGVLAEHGSGHRQRREGVRGHPARANVASRSVIGVYDSGLGGLTVLAALRAAGDRRRRRLLRRSSARTVRRTHRRRPARPADARTWRWLESQRRRSRRDGLQHVVRGRGPR